MIQLLILKPKKLGAIFGALISGISFIAEHASTIGKLFGQTEDGWDENASKNGVREPLIQVEPSSIICSGDELQGALNEFSLYANDPHKIAKASFSRFKNSGMTLRIPSVHEVTETVGQVIYKEQFDFIMDNTDGTEVKQRAIHKTTIKFN